jgi:hypothetical protein
MTEAPLAVETLAQTPTIVHQESAPPVRTFTVAPTPATHGRDTAVATTEPAGKPPEAVARRRSARTVHMPVRVARGGATVLDVNFTDPKLWPSFVAEYVGGGPLERYDIMVVPGRACLNMRGPHLIIRETGVAEPRPGRTSHGTESDFHELGGDTAFSDGARLAKPAEVSLAAKRWIARLVGRYDAVRAYPLRDLARLVALRRREDVEHDRRWRTFENEKKRKALKERLLRQGGHAVEAAALLDVKAPTVVKNLPRPNHAIVQKVR